MQENIMRTYDEIKDCKNNLFFEKFVYLNMEKESVLSLIKSTILSSLPKARVLLFGSRSRGNFDIYSDYDLLIITADLLTPKEKLKKSGELDKAIVKAIRAPVDVLIFSEKEIFEKKDLPGHIVNTAIREGVEL